MTVSRLVALAAAAGMVAAWLTGCSSHQPETSPEASSASAPVPPSVWQTRDLSALTDTLPDPSEARQGISAFVSESDGTEHVLYISKNAIQELWSDASGWHHTDVTAEAGAIPKLSGSHFSAFEAQGSTRVRYLDKRYHIIELWRDGAGWHHDDLTAAAGAPLSEGGSGFGWVFKGARHVFYTGMHHQLIELWSDGGDWHFADLSAAQDAPDTCGRYTGYPSEAQGTQHVICESGNHMYEFLWDQSGWHTVDLTVAAGAPVPLFGTTGYALAATGTQHVFYVGKEDQHVHELWWDPSGWHHNDLTIATSAPVATRDGPFLAAYPFKAQGTQHVFFSGTDGHVHELWWDPEGWHHNDLTAATGAAPSTGWGATGYAFETQGTQHVFYNGVDGHIHELWWGPKT